jgi:hypothetical protein
MNDTPDHPETDEEEEAPEEIDWDRRILCSDESCIGVIGPDGRCKECGKPYAGKLPDEFHRKPPESQPQAPADTEKTSRPQSEPAPEDVSADPEAPAGGPDSDWDNRILCSDGNCIGVIGPDGRCKECGKPYDPDSAE